MQGYALQAGDTCCLLAGGDSTLLTVVSTATIAGNSVAVVQRAGDADGRSRIYPVNRLQLITTAASNANAFCTVTASGGNTGTGAVSATAIVVGNAWVPGTYTITFTSATAYKVTNGGSAILASGSYSNPTTITFCGISVKISGSPATNDVFNVTPSAYSVAA